MHQKEVVIGLKIANHIIPSQPPRFSFWCKNFANPCIIGTRGSSSLVNQTAFLGVAITRGAYNIQSISAIPRKAIWFTRLIIGAYITSIYVDIPARISTVCSVELVKQTSKLLDRDRQQTPAFYRSKSNHLRTSHWLDNVFNIWCISKWMYIVHNLFSMVSIHCSQHKQIQTITGRSPALMN